MLTTKLYYTSPLTTDWTTMVTSFREDGDTYLVTLAETAFYPEGGGQPSDLGMIDSLHVIDVFEQDGEIYHRLPAPPQATTVHCRIDSARRLDHTQQHSGQHLLSAVCIDLFNAHTASFHLGKEVVTIDLDVPSLADEDFIAIENKVNELIYANIPVETYYVSKDELVKLPLRKLPDIDDEKIRIVEIKGIDVSACCGTHVARTGEIGIIKLLKTERHRGMTRLSFVCGKRALLDYRTNHEVVKMVSQQFGTNRDMLPHVLEKIENEKKEFQKQLEKYQGVLNEWEAEKCAREAGDSRIALRIYEHYPLKELQAIANLIATRYEKTAILASASDFRVVVVKESSSPLHLGHWFKQNLTNVNGKGGGNERQAQATLSSDQGLHEFINMLQEELNR